MNSPKDYIQNLSDNEDKTTRIFSAVAEQDIEELKLLLNSPKWYTVEGEEGFNVLETAILYEYKEVFDFLLSIEDFPLDHANPETRRSPLILSLIEYNLETHVALSEYYAIELIKKGANVHAVDTSDNINNTLLHIAVENEYVEVCRMLIEKGLGVNVENNNNETPLQILFDSVLDSDTSIFLEFLHILLYYNVDLFPPNNRSLGVQIFEECLLLETEDYVREMLFYYSVDEHSDYVVDGNTFFYLINSKNSALKYAIMEQANGIKYTQLLDYAPEIFAINNNCLKAILDKFEYFINDVIHYCLKYYDYNEFYFNTESLATFAFLLESDFSDKIIKCINYFGIFGIVKGYFRYPNTDGSIIETAKELIYYLLPYFDTISSHDLNMVYRKFGYCDLFKVLLHLEIDVDERQYDVMPGAIFDVRFDLEEYLDDHVVSDESDEYAFHMINGKGFCPGCTAEGLDKLLEYFANQTIKDFCNEQNIKKLTDKAMLLPQVPLLQELARESCRKFLVEKYNITNCRQFYTILNWLPISPVHKKIISYETPLY